MPTKYSIEDAPKASKYTVEDSTPPPPSPASDTDNQSWWDRVTAPLTEIQKPDPNAPALSGKEAVKAVGNIGAGGLGVILHPLKTAKSIGRMALDVGTSGMDPYRFGMTPTGQALAQSIQDNPLGTVEAAIGQAGATPFLEAEGKVATAPVRVLPKVLKTGAEILSGTTPKVAAELGEKTAAENAAEVKDAARLDKKEAQKHLNDTLEALEEQRGKDIEHQRALGQKTTDIETARQTQVAKTNAEHQAEIQKVNEHNARVNAKHQAAVERITQQNQAAEQTAGMRQAKADELAKETQAYYDKEDAAKSKAKAEENDAWEPWRDKMAGVSIDGGEIAKPLKELAAISPEVSRAVRQLTPSPEEAPPESQYAQDRAAIMKAQGYKGDYWDLSPDQRVQIDKIAASSGFEPEPIDFDPQSGKQIPIEQIHRANSILQRYIMSGRFEGPLLGEMKQVAKVLRAAVSRASEANGALDDLTNARNATIKYQQAFGRERNLPTTQDEIREKQANPEAFRERDDQARLDAASRVDPSLVEGYNRVKGLRAELKKFPSEDQLRKGQKQVPAPPTVGDLREGYRLKPQPTPPQKLLATPAAEEAQRTVKPPDRAKFPNRPEPNIAEIKKLGLKDIQQAKEDVMTGKKSPTEGRVAHIATGAGTWHIIRSAMFGNPLGIVTGAGVASAPMALGKILRNPAVVRILSKPTPADIASIPPDVRGPELQQIVQTAQKSGIHVHPAIVALSQTQTQNAQPQQ